MKRGELAVKLERWEPLAPCAACFLLTAVLCGAQLFGGYAPFALGLVAAAGSGKRGLAALLGGVAGALVFLDFSHALRTLAVAVLLYTANNAFCETRWYRSRRFLPAMTALMYLAVELVYLLQAGADEAALCLLSIALAVLAAVCAGALVFLDFSHALRTLAVAVLLYTANNAFCETRWYRSRRFLPAMTALMYLAVELVYLLQAGADEAALCLLSIALAVLAAVCARVVLEGKTMNEEQRQAALLVVITGVLMAASALRLENGFAPGRILAMLLVMLLAYDRSAGTALAAALGIGLAMDLTAQPGSFLHAAVYGFGALSMGRERRGRRVGAALLWCVSLLLLSLPLDAEQGLILLYEGLCATLLFLVLPNRLFGGKRLAAEKPEADTAETEEAERSTARRRLSATALALRELYDSLMRTPKAEDENPAMIFDRAAERVCRGCSLRTICWERDYAKTYNALNDATPALLAQGRGRGGDFPSYFTDRCIRFPSFLSAVNSELSAFLLRRQYRGRLADTRAQAAGQYAQLSELLSGAAETLEAQPTAAETLLTYRVGAALRPKEGENVSGDSVTHFETEDGRLCLLLSDGMGCGEEARRESALAVRLLERFLRAGVETSGALKTLNSALTLRAEVSESFTTIDLLTLSLRDGAAEVYKYGAAPSYVKRGARVRRITGSCLPAGLQSADTRPETTGFTLEKGAFFVMLSDGVADVNDDGWLMALLEKFQGDDPQALASAILAAGRERRGGDDDCAVLALYRDKDGGAVEV